MKGAWRVALHWLKAAFHDADTDILARILARMSVSVSWNAAFTAAASAAGNERGGCLDEITANVSIHQSLIAAASRNAPSRATTVDQSWVLDRSSIASGTARLSALQ